MGAVQTIPADFLARFERADIEGFIAVAIDLLDAFDGDIDVELNGDEADGSLAEDDFHPQNSKWLGEPGCPISDPDASADDFAIDESDEAELTPDWGVDQTTPLPDAAVIANDRAQLRRHRDRIRIVRCVPKWWLNSRGEIARSNYDFVLLQNPIAPMRRQLLRRKRGVPRRPRA